MTLCLPFAAGITFGRSCVPYAYADGSLRPTTSLGKLVEGAAHETEKIVR